jgi:hypothetical protein
LRGEEEERKMRDGNYGVCMIGMKEVVFDGWVVYIIDVHGLGRFSNPRSE